MSQHPCSESKIFFHSQIFAFSYINLVGQNSHQVRSSNLSCLCNIKNRDGGLCRVPSKGAGSRPKTLCEKQGLGSCVIKSKHQKATKVFRDPDSNLHLMSKTHWFAPTNAMSTKMLKHEQQQKKAAKTKVEFFLEIFKHHLTANFGERKCL